MRKLIIPLIFLSLVSLLLLSLFGPWDTYITSVKSDGLSQYTYVSEFPVWLGEILRYTDGAITVKEDKENQRKWLENHPEYKDIYQINEYGNLEFIPSKEWIEYRRKMGELD